MSPRQNEKFDFFAQMCEAGFTRTTAVHLRPLFLSWLKLFVFKGSCHLVKYWRLTNIHLLALRTINIRGAEFFKIIYIYSV